jgi:hypothetical protein
VVGFDCQPTERMERFRMSDKFVIHTEQELLDRPLPEQLVDGLVVQNAIAMLVANYGVGKSFVALDLALSIASGQPTFLGLPLRKSGPVLYVLAEGAGRFKLRVLAWKTAHGVTRSLPFYWINVPVNLLEETEVDAFIKALQSIRPVFVVIDTLSRCLVGADENSQAMMTTAIESCERIRGSGTGKHEGPTLLILHHTGASGKRERGSTVIPGGIDTQIRLDPATRKVGTRYAPIKGVLKLTTTKQKDLDGTDEPIVLRKKVLEAPGAFEANGEPATSCIWVPEGTDLQPDPLILAVQTDPGLTKNRLAKSLGGNKAHVFERLRQLESGGVIRIVHEGQNHRVYLANDESTDSHKTPSGPAASRSGESLRDSHTGTGRVANRAEPAVEPDISKESGKTHSRNRIGNRVSALPMGTSRKNLSEAYWIPRSKKHGKAITAMG